MGSKSGLPEIERNLLGAKPRPGYECLIAQRNDDEQVMRDRAAIRHCLERTYVLNSDSGPVIDAMVIEQLVKVREKPKAAVSSLRKALQLGKLALLRDPSSAYAQAAMAQASYANGLCDQGRMSAHRALELNPFDPILLGRMGVQMFQCNDPAFEKTVQRAKQLDPDVPTAVNIPLVLMLAEEGRKADAVKLVASLQSSDKGGIPTAINIVLAIAQAANGDRLEALSNHGRHSDGGGRHPTTPWVYCAASSFLSGCPAG